MLAVDTKVVVRYLTDDDPHQSPRARRLVDGNDVWVATSVLLETGWVLGSVYRCTSARIASALRKFGGLPSVTLEDPALSAQTLDWVEQGMDFADALHLAAAGHCEALATFDMDFIKTAKKLSAVSVRAP
jgi:predicted nucleic acid-binding protein